MSTVGGLGCDELYTTGAVLYGRGAKGVGRKRLNSACCDAIVSYRAAVSCGRSVR